MSSTLFDMPSAPAAWFTAHCDGGSRGNPGPAAYGAVIQNPQGQVVARLSQFLGMQTNNYAEYQGLLAVLEWALANQIRQLRVVADSELMVNQMKGRYKVASPTLRPLWEEARRRAARLDRFEMTHTLRGGNKEADRLANEAMDRGMGGRASGKSGGQPVGGSASQQRPPAAQAPPPGPGAPERRKAPRQVFEGYVKNGVVHLLDGELPEGTFVKIVRD